MKIRFWQRAYVLTLVLFLLCLYAGAFFLAYNTYKRSVKNAEALSQSQQNYIAVSFERDFSVMSEAGAEANPSLLMRSYCSNYEKQRIYLGFFEDGEALCSSLPDGIGEAAEGTISTERASGERYTVIGDGVCDGRYSLTFCAFTGDLDEEFKSLAVNYAIVSAAVSAVLAAALMIIMKRLSAPLEKLRDVTVDVASGNMDAKADEKGRDEVADLAKSFNAMVATVKDQMDELSNESERKQMLVDNMAHELKTPLTSIKGYADYIEKAAVSEEEKLDAARRIVSEADRLAKISQIILDTAVIRGEGIKREKVDVGKVLSDTAERLRAKAEGRGTELSVSDGGCVVDGDETLLSMLFYNLTENAIKATGAGCRVELSCGGTKASVRDDGKGMTAEQLSHVTEPFYRTDKSRSRAEGGAGLGLTLCSKIAEAHGAALSFESEPGVGTCVTVSFGEEGGA